MTAPFPHRYEARLRWDDGRRGTLSAPPRPSLGAGPPPEFDGDPALWSPEHLLLGAAASCLMTTFLSMAERSKLSVLGYECRARGTLDKTPEGFRFTEIRLAVALKTAEADAERGRRLLETAARHCIVANSLKTPVILEAAAPAA